MREAGLQRLFRVGEIKKENEDQKNTGGRREGKREGVDGKITAADRDPGSFSDMKMNILWGVPPP